MSRTKKNRRDFLKSSSSVLGVSWAAMNMPLILAASQNAQSSMLAASDYQHISVAEAVEFSAIADQIIPQDETAGATEIGVVYFIDAAMGSFLATQAPMLRQGLVDLNQKAKELEPQISRFSDLSLQQQETLLKALESNAFFTTMHFLTLCGMFCLPEYGGNRDRAGWDLVGFDHRHAWQAPFGYYDAAAMKTSSGGSK